MKEHESRLLELDEYYYVILKHFNRTVEKYKLTEKNIKNGCFYYVDSNNYLHNLNDKATKNNYYIHGEKISNKAGYLIINRMKMLEEL